MITKNLGWHFVFSIWYSVTNPMKRTLTKGLLWAIEQGQKRKSVKYKILFTLMLPGLFVEQQTVFSGPPTTHLVKVFDNKKWCRACVNCYRYTQQEEHYHIKCLGWGSIFVAQAKATWKLNLAWTAQQSVKKNSSTQPPLRKPWPTNLERQESLVYIIIRYDLNQFRI